MTTGLFYGTPNPLNPAAASPISSTRAPTTTDLGFGQGQFWIFQPSGQLYYLANITAGVANWIIVGTGPGSVNTVNLVPPAAGNINLVNQGGAGAVVITAPGSGGANSVGLAVNVDGVTIQIIGNQLVAVAAVPPLTLTGNLGGAQFYAANNFNIQGQALGAIETNTTGAGQLNIRAIPDDVTIEINASNELQVINNIFLTLQTPAGGSDTDTLPVAKVANSTSVTFDAILVGREVAAPFRSVYGRFVSGYKVDGGGTVTIAPMAADSFVQSELTMNPVFQLISGGLNDLQFQITDTSGIGPIDWKVDVDLLILP